MLEGLGSDEAYPQKLLTTLAESLLSNLEREEQEL